MTPAQRREDAVEECRQSGAHLADALIDFAIRTFNDDRDPTGVVEHINKYLKDQWRPKKLAHGRSLSCEAIGGVTMSAVRNVARNLKPPAKP